MIVLESLQSLTEWAADISQRAELLETLAVAWVIVRTKVPTHEKNQTNANEGEYADNY